MIDDTISRQALYDEIENWENLSKYYHPKSKNNKIPIEELLTIIKYLPSVTPQEGVKNEAKIL